jgi:hypothetical protein
LLVLILLAMVNLIFTVQVVNMVHTVLFSDVRHR